MIQPPLGFNELKCSFCFLGDEPQSLHTTYEGGIKPILDGRDTIGQAQCASQSLGEGNMLQRIASPTP